MFLSVQQMLLDLKQLWKQTIYSGVQENKFDRSEIYIITYVYNTLLFVSQKFIKNFINLYLLYFLHNTYIFMLWTGYIKFATL